MRSVRRRAGAGKKPPSSGEARERPLLDEIGAAVIATDPGGAIVSWNRHAEEMFGSSREEALDKSFLELVVDPADREAARGVLECLGAGQPWEGEVHTVAGDREPVIARLKASPMHDPAGNISGMAAVLVDISDVKHAQRRLATQHAVTRVLAESETLAEATPRILEAVGETLHWEMGAIWELDRAGRLLRCVETWQAPGGTSDEFDALTRQTAFPSGVGLPGRVWASGEPAWIPDVARDSNFPRAPVAAQHGLHAAFAFPIVIGGEVLGVIEFFSSAVREPDTDLVAMMSAIGSQIGQFIERKEAEEAVRASEARKSAVVQAALDCIITIDHEGRVVEFNPAAEQTFGYAAEDIVGKEMAQFIVPRAPRGRHREGLARYLAKGPGAFIGRRVELTALRSDGSEFPVEVSITAIEDENGPPMFTGFLRDISDRRRAEEARARILSMEQAARRDTERARERTEFLAEAGAVLASSLDHRKTLNKVVRLVVPRLADWCSVDVLEDGEIRSLAIAHAEEDLVERARELRRRWPPRLRDTRGATAVIRSGHSELFTNIPASILEEVARDEEHLEALQSLGFRSAMVVPLTARGRTFGAVTIVSAHSGRLYDEDDLALAEELAARAAQAVDNARLYQERAHVARALQQTLLPQHLPEIGWCEVAARYQAAGQGEVGGDFYDVFEATDGAWFAAIGDVQGKGPEAAAVTGLARYTIKAAAATERNPSRILRTLNQTMLREGTERFLTVALCRFQLHNGMAQVAISCGGHPPPFILRGSGSIEGPDCKGGLLGAFESIDLSDSITELEPGDALVLYTDGLTEERGGHRVFGEGPLERLLQDSIGLDAETLAGRIEQGVLEFRGEEPRDDMAILVMRFLPERVAPAAQGV
ncbi:MAG: PAS domain S-box protein [Actinomycetota bacterium]